MAKTINITDRVTEITGLPRDDVRRVLLAAAPLIIRHIIATPPEAIDAILARAGELSMNEVRELIIDYISSEAVGQL